MTVYKPTFTPEEMARANEQWANTAHTTSLWNGLLPALATFGGAAALPGLAGSLGVGGATAATAAGAAPAVAPAVAPGVVPPAAKVGANWIGPAINGAAQVGSGLIGKSGNNKAAEAQRAANDNALQYQRDSLAEQKRQFDVQQAAAKAEYERKVGIEQPYLNASNSILQQNANRLGLGNMGSMTAPGYVAPSAVMAPGLAVANQAASKAPTTTLGSLANYGLTTSQDTKPTTVDPLAPSFATLQNWNQWGRG